MTFAKDRTEWLERKAAEREARLSTPTPPARTLHKPTYTGGTSGQAVEKTPRYEDKALTDMAKDRPCLLMVPAVCNHRQDTTVACHSNLSIHGKGVARKADDTYTVWGCFSCHYWLDHGKARAEDKEPAFMAAHARQVLAWRLIAADPNEPERFRNAATRALEKLNATPTEGAGNVPSLEA